MHIPPLHFAINKESGQNIIAVGRDDKTLYRQAHLHRHPAGKNIAKITCWHAKGHRLVRRTKCNCRGKIIDNLRHQTRPVNRVYRRQPYLVAERPVIKTGLYQRLAIIKIAFYRNCLHPCIANRGHLFLLDRRYAPLWKQDKNINRLPPFKGFQRGRACIPTGCAQNNRMAVLAAKGAIKRP